MYPSKIDSLDNALSVNLATTNPINILHQGALSYYYLLTSYSLKNISLPRLEI